MILALLAAVALQPQPILTIDPKHRLIEGIATDGSTIFVSSVLDRTILACKDNACRTFALLPKGLHPMGMAWSGKHLWVAADCPELPGIVKCDRGALFAFDPRGRVQTRIAPASGSFHPGDVSASTGGVFVSDSHNGAVYRLAKDGHSLSGLVAPGIGKSAQGSALDIAGTRLIAADYEQGVNAIDLAGGVRTVLKRADGRPVHGIDGMLRCSDSYYAVYNGVPPGWLVRITVEGDTIAFEKLIEGAPLIDATQLATDGNRLLVVADAGWEGAAKGAPRATGSTILAVPLEKPCGP